MERAESPDFNRMDMEDDKRMSLDRDIAQYQKNNDFDDDEDFTGVVTLDGLKKSKSRYERDAEL